jgi:catechol 2,3-dioxygenase-like lactoylglutathione lyase family enzyme
MTDWFARPVLHVLSVEASLRFYVDRLGFTVAWRYEEDGRARVAQVDRGSCALIFLRPVAGEGRQGSDVHFPERRAREARGRDRGARRVARRVRSPRRSRQGRHWGYRLLAVEDLDGNQLFFNYPNEPLATEAVNQLVVAKADSNRMEMHLTPETAKPNDVAGISGGACEGSQ